LLSLENIEAGYGGSIVLRRAALDVKPGQVVCLMGRNGVGKTTLLKTIMGLLRAQSGTITFDGADFTNAPTDARARAGIGYVPQGREIFPQLSVQENLDIGLEAARGRSQVDKVPDLIFDLFPILGKMLHRKGGALSGGQQQQLAIGRALVATPKLLLLDEPTEGIQPSVVQQIEDAIVSIKRKGDTAVLLVEQGLDFATRIADYTYVLDRGTIVAHGDAREMTADKLRHHLTV
jgi:urea transport system ATP-binding protein